MRRKPFKPISLCNDTTDEKWKCMNHLSTLYQVSLSLNCLPSHLSLCPEVYSPVWGHDEPHHSEEYQEILYSEQELQIIVLMFTPTHNIVLFIIIKRCRFKYSISLKFVDSDWLSIIIVGKITLKVIPIILFLCVINIIQ